jgi:hypothetical protein
MSDIKYKIKSIKLSRLSKYEKLVYVLLENTKLIDNLFKDSDTKYLLSPNNDVLLEVNDSLNMVLFRFNYDIIWIPILQGKVINLEDFVYPYIINRMNLDVKNKILESIGGVSIKFMPYDKY